MSKQRHGSNSRLESALASIIDNRIEQRQGELRELIEMKASLGQGKLEESKAWRLLDKLWR